MSFKIGDIITGIELLGLDQYGVTNHYATMEVLELFMHQGRDLVVKVLTHETLPHEIGNIYNVSSIHFKLANSTKEKHMFKVGDIVIGNQKAEHLYNRYTEGVVATVFEIVRAPNVDSYRIVLSLDGGISRSIPLDPTAFDLHFRVKTTPVKSRKELIKSKLSDDEIALYDLTKRKKLSKFHTHVRDRIQNIRYETMDQRRDKLFDKMTRFGNQGKWGTEKIRELSKMIYLDKSPEAVNLGDWLSVEIECVFTSKNAETAFVSFVRKNAWTKYVTVKSDGSVKPNQTEGCGEEHVDDDGNDMSCGEYGCSVASPDYGKEIVITFQYGNWAFVQAICEKLRELECYVNKSCGLHVHFDCRHLTARQVTTLGKRVALCVPALHMILPKSRRENRFCSKPINTHKNTSGEGRYSFVNLGSYAKHKTLEIRGHSGTTDATKIINWIMLMKAIMCKSNKTSISAPLDLLSLLGKSISKELAEYILQRQLKFASKGLVVPQDDVASDDAVQELLQPAHNHMQDLEERLNILEASRPLRPQSGTSIQLNEGNLWYSMPVTSPSYSAIVRLTEEALGRLPPNLQRTGTDDDDVGF